MPKIGSPSILAARDSVDIVLEKQQINSAYDIPLIQMESVNYEETSAEGSLNLIAGEKIPKISFISTTSKSKYDY